MAEAAAHPGVMEVWRLYERSRRVLEAHYRLQGVLKARPPVRTTDASVPRPAR